MEQFTIPSFTGNAVRQGQAAIPPGLRVMTITTTDEQFDPGETVDALFEVSFNGGATWKHEASCTGMRPTAESPHMSLAVTFGNPEDPYPTHIRATVTPQGGPVRFGAVVTVE